MHGVGVECEYDPAVHQVLQPLASDDGELRVAEVPDGAELGEGLAQVPRADGEGVAVEVGVQPLDEQRVGLPEVDHLAELEALHEELLLQREVLELVLACAPPTRCPESAVHRGKVHGAGSARCACGRYSPPPPIESVLTSGTPRSSRSISES